MDMPAYIYIHTLMYIPSIYSLLDLFTHIHINSCDCLSECEIPSFVVNLKRFIYTYPVVVLILMLPVLWSPMRVVVFYFFISFAPFLLLNSLHYAGL